MICLDEHTGKVLLQLELVASVSPVASAILPAGSDPDAVAAELTAVLQAVFREKLGETLEWGLAPFELRPRSCSGPILSSPERQAAFDANWERIRQSIREEPLRPGMERHPEGTGYRYTLHGRPYLHSQRCDLCRELGAFVDTGCCEECEVEVPGKASLIQAVGGGDV